MKRILGTVVLSKGVSPPFFLLLCCCFFGREGWRVGGG